tara:strand:- start:675 stop:1199 length:525 start_codon:yes stop_codon:yes gene_type:complete
MKSFVYLLSIILIIAVVGFFVFKQPNGQAWLSIDDFVPNTQIISEKINLATNKINAVFKKPISKNDSTIKVYRWKDSNGNWSYSDKPKASIESEEMLFDQENIVVLPAFDQPTIDALNSNPKGKYDNDAPNTLLSKPGKVLELYKDAKNVQKLMDTRQQNISKAIKESTGKTPL